MAREWNTNKPRQWMKRPTKLSFQFVRCRYFCFHSKCYFGGVQLFFFLLFFAVLYFNEFIWFARARSIFVFTIYLHSLYNTSIHNFPWCARHIPTMSIIMCLVVGVAFFFSSVVYFRFVDCIGIFVARWYFILWFLINLNMLLIRRYHDTKSNYVHT